MSRNAAMKPDAPAAWGAWMASGSPEAAAGQPVTYRLALDLARQNVIEDLRSRPPR